MGWWLLNALERAAEGKRGRQGGGSGGEDATRHGEGVGPGPDLVPADRGPTAACGRRALFRAGGGCVRSLKHGTRLAAGEGGRRERRGACMGRPGKERGGPSRMNSNDCELLKWILNEFDLF
jgi:hypothetical protein